MSDAKAVVSVYSYHVHRVPVTVANPLGLENGEPKEYCVELRGPISSWRFLPTVLDASDRIFRVGAEEYCRMIATKLNKAALNPSAAKADAEIGL